MHVDSARLRSNGESRYRSVQLIPKRVEVSLASSGEEALERLETTPFHLIFLDVQMPGLDGFETTREIRRRYGQGLPVVGISGNAFARDREEGLNAGMNDYLTKPVKKIELAERLARFLG